MVSTWHLISFLLLLDWHYDASSNSNGDKWRYRNDRGFSC